MSKTKLFCTALGAAALVGSATAAASAVDDPYISQVTAFGFNFCPSGWVETDGRLLNISNYTTLYALIGTTFGGNGTSNFAVPDLQGRVSVGQGTGPGLSPWVRGQSGGSATTTLTVAQLPSHNHGFQATSTIGSSQDPTGRTVASFAAAPAYAPAGTQVVAMIPSTIGAMGGGQPVSIQDPIMAVTMCIATQGVFPPRN